jgi:hypothetical protein
MAIATNMLALTFMSVGGSLPFIRNGAIRRSYLPVSIFLTDIVRLPSLIERCPLHRVIVRLAFHEIRRLHSFRHRFRAFTGICFGPSSSDGKIGSLFTAPFVAE